MKKEHVIGGITLAVLIIVLVFAGFYVYQLLNPSKQTKVATVDEINFKKEYEDKNGTNNTEGVPYPLVTIDELNKASYITESGVVDMIKSGTGIIYFGFPTCPWCRTMLPVFLKAIEDSNVDNFYYLNALDIRDTMTLNEKNEPYRSKEGTEGYYQILELLDSILEDYKLTIEIGKNKGKAISAGEKRLYVPTIIFVKDGKIEDYYFETIDSKIKPYEALTKKEKNELYEILSIKIKKVL